MQHLNTLNVPPTVSTLLYHDQPYSSPAEKTLLLRGRTAILVTCRKECFIIEKTHYANGIIHKRRSCIGLYTE
jgi:hypothetical protein